MPLARLRPLALLAALALSLAGCGGGGGSDDDLALVRSLSYLQPAAAPALGAGKAVVVEFWATWCPPCVTSTPHLAELDRRHRDQGLVIVGVHVARGAEQEAQVRAFVEQHEVEYAIALDLEGEVQNAYGVDGIPAAFVYDRSGALIWKGNPLDPGFDAAVARALG